jgi:hypothetical protein
VTYLKTWRAGTGIDGVAARNDAIQGAVDSCAEWGRQVIARIVDSEEIEAVVCSNYTERSALESTSGLGRPVTAEGFLAAWQPMLDSGKRVVAVRDLPNSNGVFMPQCVAQHLDMYGPYATDREDALFAAEVDPMLVAAGRSSGVSVLELTDVLCAKDRCHSVISGLIVYFDSHHMAATFSRTLARPGCRRPHCSGRDRLNLDLKWVWHDHRAALSLSGSHQSRFSRYHRTTSANPCSNGTRGA